MFKERVLSGFEATVDAWEFNFPSFMVLFLSDINECSSSNGGCSHSCHNSAGSFTCSCPSGLELDPGKRSCIGEVKTHRHQVVGVFSDFAFSNTFAGVLEQTTYVLTNTY